MMGGFVSSTNRRSKCQKMDSSLKARICNQIFKFEFNVQSASEGDASFTLDYEDGRYRQKELVGIIRDAVPFFALTEDEIATIDRSDWNKSSFARISDANRNSKGDYGELLLFLILSIFYDTPKFVTKARLRSTTREQIKGFDCAHFSIENGKYELLKSYVNGGKSLDKVDIAVPVLCTYDSSVIKQFSGGEHSDIDSDEFKNHLSLELEENFAKIHRKSWPKKNNIKIVFFVMPLESVSKLKESIELVENAMKF